MGTIAVRTALVRAIGAVILMVGLLVAPSTRAVAAPESRENIVITKDSEFNPAHGVRSGEGTKKNPYVISGWRVSSLVLKDTSKYVLVRDNVVSGQMVLDWNGRRLTVRNNQVRDLRVNQNVPRKGEATGGVISNNKFDLVGQLRHWDGIFEKNTIGADTPIARRSKAVQFDGFHGSRFRNNTIFGYVDIKLHGHHHGSGFKKSSHYHGGEGGASEQEMSGHDHGNKRADHSKRYHEVFVTGNRITSDHAWSLRYYDQAHTGDDRTNASETNKLLNCPHVHYTRIHLNNNKITGGGIAVDVFNADDENHWGTKTGVVEVEGNTIQVARDTSDLTNGGRYGILVQQAKDVMVHIARNKVLGARMVSEHDVLKLEKELNAGAGISLLSLDRAKVHLYGNVVAHRTFGIVARSFPRSVNWWIKSLNTNDVKHPVFYDDSVANPPNRSKG